MGDGRSEMGNQRIRKAKSGKKLILEKLQAVFTAEAQRTRRGLV
jgi:hypothetical protein